MLESVVVLHVGNSVDVVWEWSDNRSALLTHCTQWVDILAHGLLFPYAAGRYIRQLLSRQTCLPLYKLLASSYLYSKQKMS